MQGHDHEREQEFFAGEIKSQRLVTDWPMTWRVLRSNTAWSGVMRFWFGWLYQIFSSWPITDTAPCVLASGHPARCWIHAGTKPDVAKRRGSGNVLTYVTTSWEPWAHGQPCYAGLIRPSGQPDPRLTGLAEPVRTNQRRH